MKSEIDLIDDEIASLKATLGFAVEARSRMIESIRSNVYYLSKDREYTEIPEYKVGKDQCVAAAFYALKRHAGWLSSESHIKRSEDESHYVVSLSNGEDYRIERTTYTNVIVCKLEKLRDVVDLRDSWKLAVKENRTSLSLKEYTETVCQKKDEEIIEKLSESGWEVTIVTVPELWLEDFVVIHKPNNRRY